MSILSFLKNGLIVLGSGVFLQGCTGSHRDFFHDKERELTKESYKNLPQKRVALSASQDPPLPGEKGEGRGRLSSFLQLRLQTPVSLSVTQDVPLKDIFLELLSQADIEGDISGEITNRGSLSLKNRPLQEVLDRLCELHNLRLIFLDSYLRIEPDQPFVKAYEVPSLSLKRSGRHQIGVATDVFNGRKKGEENGSSSSLIGESTTDFWQELATNLTTLLSDESVKGEEKKAPLFTLNKQAGLVTVKGTGKQHTLVASYLTQLKSQSNAQVLIEAKIIEVSLDDSYRHGINWRLVTDHLGLSGPFGQAPHLFPSVRNSQEMFTFSAKGKDMGVLLDFLETFGTSRTLSNPRLTVMNNQSAILKVAQNYVYFTMNYSRQGVSFPSSPSSFSSKSFYYDAPITNVTSEVHTVPIGLVMVVQASINQETEEITLVLRPTITTIVGQVEDPAVAILSDKQAHSKIPVVEVREIDSILQTQSGQVAVVGGLMRNQGSHRESGLPGASSLPLGSFLFSGRDQDTQMTELVILIKATIVKNPSMGPGDHHLSSHVTPLARQWS
jgi:general secretion pathway protein D